MSEKEFQRMVIRLANMRGWLAYHTYDSRRCVAGYPDLTLLRPPRLIFAELKTDKGRLRPEQEIWLERLKGTSAEVVIWRPKQWKEIEEMLK